MPSDGAPTAFMAAPVIDQGVVIGVLIAQLSIDEIDNVVTGDRRWRQEGFGATGEAYLVGSDYFVRSGPRAFYENRDLYFAELKGGGESGQGHRGHPPLRHAGAAAARRHPGEPRGAGRRRGHRRDRRLSRHSRRSPRGGRSRFPASNGR